jgi:hypothetical protein
MTNDKLSAVVASVPGVRKVAGMATHLIADETDPTPEWSTTLALVSDTIHTLCDAVDRLARDNADLRRAKLNLILDREKIVVQRDEAHTELAAFKAERAAYNEFMTYDNHPTALMVDSGDYPTAYEVWYEALDRVGLDLCGQSVSEFCDGSEEIPTPVPAIRVITSMLSNALYDAGLHDHEMTAKGLAKIAVELISARAERNAAYSEVDGVLEELIKPTGNLIIACEGRFASLAISVAKLTAERDRLAGVVAKLPVTVDGVPVVPGMTVWQIDPSGFINSPGSMTGPDPNPQPWSVIWHGGGHILSMPCYSTREAAEAARKGGAS